MSLELCLALCREPLGHWQCGEWQCEGSCRSKLGNLMCCTQWMMERVQLAWRDGWRVDACRPEQAIRMIETDPGRRDPRDCLQLGDLEEMLGTLDERV